MTARSSVENVKESQIFDDVSIDCRVSGDC